MKKWGLFAMKKQLLAMFAVFLLAVFIGRIYHDDFVQSGDYFEVFTSYHNAGQHKAENLQLTVYIPELGLYTRSNTFDLKTGDNGGRYVLAQMPSDAQSGWYRMWVMLSGDQYRDYAFNWIYVG
ncbi:hypothetical protein COT47_02855 [Candidatus Woesearchaeota archaeon CG08_land_8_20_14_0_20_43_7]|nr:MAG: hypothetical protein COT47_02855 [Candidatus Woesearchaeota archaeon CG08_land_8_20_14_0_20_43_7]